MELNKKNYHTIQKINLQKPILNHSKQTIKKIYYKPNINNPINISRKNSKHKILISKLGT